jgi:hypothetical protein
VHPPVSFVLPFFIGIIGLVSSYGARSPSGNPTTTTSGHSCCWCRRATTNRLCPLISALLIRSNVSIAVFGYYDIGLATLLIPLYDSFIIPISQWFGNSAIVSIPFCEWFHFSIFLVKQIGVTAVLSFCSSLSFPFTIHSLLPTFGSPLPTIADSFIAVVIVPS